MGYNISNREGAFAPALSALEDGMDNQSDVCDAGEYLYNRFDFVQLALGLFLFPAHRVTSFLSLL